MPGEKAHTAAWLPSMQEQVKAGLTEAGRRGTLIPGLLRPAPREQQSTISVQRSQATEPSLVLPCTELA